MAKRHEGVRIFMFKSPNSDLSILKVLSLFLHNGIIFVTLIISQELIQMKSNLRNALVICLILPLVFACRKKKNKDVSPFGEGKPVCPLLALTSETGKTIQDFEYVKDNLIRIYSFEESKTTMSFKYNEKNVITNMKVETENDLETLNVDYIYDAEGRVSQTPTSYCRNSNYYEHFRY